MDLTEYKQFENSNYYINKEGLVYNNIRKNFLKIKKNSSVQLFINKQSKTISIKKVLNELFSNIDLTEYTQIKNSNYYINKESRVINKSNEEVKGRNCKNYVVISIQNNKKNESHYIHRLVAETFLPNPDNLPEVHHKDNNKSNNKLNNLEWTTKSKNCRMSNKRKKSGLPRGVSYNNVVKKYQAQISNNCKIKHLGYFSTPEEAHIRYLEEYKIIMGVDCIYN